MANLSPIEKRILERVLGMGDGHLLNFSRRQLLDFVESTMRINPWNKKYDIPDRSDSKANRMRGIWKVEPDYVVGKLLNHLLLYAASEPNFEKTTDYYKAVEIAARCAAGTQVDIDALSLPDADEDFDLLAEEVQEAIDRGKPVAGLDRLHTFAVKFFRQHAEARGVEDTKDKPLHSVVGEYVGKLRDAGLLESKMTGAIMKSATKTLQTFNDVRNKQTLTHDNDLLNHDEATLICGHVCDVIRFVRTLEEKTRPEPEPDDAWLYSDEIPF